MYVLASNQPKNVLKPFPSPVDIHLNSHKSAPTFLSR